MIFEIEKIYDLPLDSLSDAIAESRSYGFKFLQRLADEWTSGTNRFDRPGEALFVVKQGDRMIGICGLNADPYSVSAKTGRVRRLYIMEEYRRRGIGRALALSVIAEASPNFDRLHVRTDDPASDKFYQSLGFTLVFGDEYCTHALTLTRSESQPV